MGQILCLPNHVSSIDFSRRVLHYIVTCLTEGNDRIRDTAGNNCKLVYKRIRDTVAPFLVTVTVGLYGYEANNGMRGYVATGESALEVSLRQLVSGNRRGESSSVSPRGETSVQYSSVRGIQGATSAIVFTVIVMCAAVNLQSE
jgi:hypothetical protein